MANIFNALNPLKGVDNAIKGATSVMKKLDGLVGEVNDARLVRDIDQATTTATKTMVTAQELLRSLQETAQAAQELLISLQYTRQKTEESIMETTKTAQEVLRSVNTFTSNPELIRDMSNIMHALGHLAKAFNYVASTSEQAFDAIGGAVYYSGTMLSSAYGAGSDAFTSIKGALASTSEQAFDAIGSAMDHSGHLLSSAYGAGSDAFASAKDAIWGIFPVHAQDDSEIEWGGGHNGTDQDAIVQVEQHQDYQY